MALDLLPREPVEWDRPHDGDDPWACFRWDRRAYDEVMEPEAALALALP